ncbi:hypothetical protein ACLFMI_03025 [Pseudonocardia nantongensis]|uniref:hypothetical protein n=1 Tax=Pseudonocardia nantongensis TaxID=1181885 RepID=UPI00397CCA8E
MTDPRLPERLALAPHHLVLSRGPGSCQVGTGPDRARVLDGLSPGLLAMLDRLMSGPCPVATLLDLAGPRGPAAGLLVALRTDGLLTDPDAGRRARSSSLVVVRGDGPLAVAVALGLARAGVGLVYPRVTGTAGSDDVAAGLPRRDAGRDRGPALARLLAAECPDTRTGPPGSASPDLVLLTGAAAAPEPGDVVEHLPVTLRDGRGVVGPLVLPGRSPCLRCVERTRTDRDPGWPLIAAQLATHPPTAAPHTVTATAGLAVGQALAALEGPARGDPAPASLGALLELDPHTAAITVRTWTVHPACRCGAPRPAATGTHTGRTRRAELR